MPKNPKLNISKSNISKPKIAKTDEKDKAKAKQVLSRVPEDKVFWCNNGQIFHSLEELVDGLEQMADETYIYHCNEEKNDFSAWVMDVVGDEDLAKEIKSAKTRQQAGKQVKQRYSDLTRLEG
jgi:hypothetical protein